MTLRSLSLFAALCSTVIATPAWAQDACSRDTDCKGVSVCEAGKCVSPGKPATPAPEPAPAAPTPEPVAVAPVAAPVAAVEAPIEPAAPHAWRPRLSAYYIINPGVGGDAQNVSAGSSFGLEASLPIAGRFRYRPIVGFETVSSLNGVRLEPLALGMTFDIPMASRDVHLAIEPTVSLLQSEIFIDVAGTGNAVLFFSSGFDVAVALQTGPVVLSIAPIGADFRFASWAPSPNGATSADFGMNWRGRVSVGFEL